MRLTFYSIIISALCLLGFSVCAEAQNKEDKQPTTEELATKEADRLGDLLKLEDWQIFYVDSTLQHDYAALKKEMEDMQKSKVENYNLYQTIHDKWMEQIDNTYKKYFNAAQWKKYLKTGAGREMKAREKRKAKAEKAKEKNNK